MVITRILKKKIYIYIYITIEKKLLELTEDAYAFCSSFTIVEDEMEIDSVQETKSNQSPGKLTTQLAYLSKFNIDYESVKKYIKNLIKCFPNDKAL